MHCYVLATTVLTCCRELNRFLSPGVFKTRESKRRVKILRFTFPRVAGGAEKDFQPPALLKQGKCKQS